MFPVADNLQIGDGDHCDNEGYGSQQSNQPYEKMLLDAIFKCAR